MLFELITEAATLIPAMVASSTEAADSAPSEGMSENLENLIPIVAIVLGCTIAIVAILASMVSNGQREKTRREIAAYVAEGSISPDDAERMMKAASNCSKG